MSANFEKATRLKLRFDTEKGLLSVEDLWDLPLTSTKGKVNLNDIARGLHFKLRDSSEVSFVTPVQKDETTQLAFDVVKHVIEVKIVERDEAATKAANAEKKQKLLAILENKENEELSAKSSDEIRALIASM